MAVQSPGPPGNNLILNNDESLTLSNRVALVTRPCFTGLK